MEVLIIVGVLVGFLLIVAIRDILRDRRKFKTLRQTEDGTWVWIGLDGQTQTSPYYPCSDGGSSFGGGGHDGASGDGGGGGD